MNRAIESYAYIYLMTSDLIWFGLWCGGVTAILFTVMTLIRMSDVLIFHVLSRSFSTLPETLLIPSHQSATILWHLLCAKFVQTCKMNCGHEFSASQNINGGCCCCCKCECTQTTATNKFKSIHQSAAPIQHIHTLATDDRCNVQKFHERHKTNNRLSHHLWIPSWNHELASVHVDVLAHTHTWKKEKHVFAEHIQMLSETVYNAFGRVCSENHTCQKLSQ